MSLQAQIQDLRVLTTPKNDPRQLSVLQIEADAVLSGQDRVINVDNLQSTDVDDNAEMIRILSGQY